MTEAVRLLDCVATQGRDTASQATTRPARPRHDAGQGRWAGSRRAGRAGGMGMGRAVARARQKQAGRAAGRMRCAGRAERGRGAQLKSNLTRLHPNLGLALSNNKINK